MSVDMFLKLDGIDGEAVDDAHTDEIDVLAWSWGMSQSGTTHIAKGGGAGKVAVQDLSVTKYVDRSSATIMSKIATGEHISEAIITVRKAGKQPLEYIIITMEDVLISSYSTGGSGGEDKLTENVTLNFATVKAVYVPQKADGTGDPEVEFGHDIAKNIPI